MHTHTHARRFVYEAPMPVGRLVRQVADKHQVCTQMSWKRPFGVGMLVSGACAARARGRASGCAVLVTSKTRAGGDNHLNTHPQRHGSCVCVLRLDCGGHCGAVAQAHTHTHTHTAAVALRSRVQEFVRAHARAPICQGTRASVTHACVHARRL
jgi:hypothetical protein